MKRRWLRILPATCMLMASAAHAQGVGLAWPVACEYGKDCFIQNYVDQDSTKAARDFTCGPLSYDGHKGTDIRLVNEAVMRKGIAVLAAADGTVRATRDGMDDVNVKSLEADAVKNRECGNGVVIHHGTGYETQYCHLMKGSITVKQGQPVKAGAVLGRIGMSGASEFPHLHFEVRRLGKVIDPFTAEPTGGSCGKKTANLWKYPVAYQPTALMGQGFTTSIPDSATIRRVGLTLAEIPRTSPALVYWVDIMGIRQGDLLKLRVLTPNGLVAVERDVPMTRNLAQTFSYVGKKATPEGMVPGAYKASFTLLRKDEVVLQGETEVNVPF